MSTFKKVLIGAAIVTVAGVLGAVNVGSRRERGTQVRIETVERRDLVASVTASGRIEPRRKVDVSADITGRITKLTVREGDWVDEGTLLVQIEPDQYRSGVRRAEAALASSEASAAQAKANRDQAERAFRRIEQLRAQTSNAVSEEAIENARRDFDVNAALHRSATHQVEQARAAVKEAEDQLAKTSIRAPMSGRVTRLAVEQGEVAVPGTFSRETGLLMTISDLNVIQAVVEVDETDVVRISIGDSADVEIDAFPDTSFVGRVTKISNSAIRPSSASSSSSDQAVDFEVEIVLANPPPDVRPDLSATSRVVTETRQDVLSIPIIALTVREHEEVPTEVKPNPAAAGRRPRNEREGVFVVSRGVATFRPVRVGIAGGEYFEVIEGVAAGDSIVAGPYQAIRDLEDDEPVRSTKETARGRTRANR